MESNATDKPVPREITALLSDERLILRETQRAVTPFGGIKIVPTRLDLSTRINKLPKWARDYIHNIHTFVGAPEVEELTYLRDQNKALIKLVGELKAETRRLMKKR